MLDRGSLRWAVWSYIESSLLVIAGILCIVFSGNDDLQKWAIVALGVLIIIDAGARLLLGVMSIVETKVGKIVSTSFSRAVAGSFELAGGISVVLIGTEMSNATAIFQFIGNFIGILLMVFGLILASYAIVYLIRKSQGKFLSVMELILSAGLISVGVLCIVYLQNQAIVVQAALVAFGISILVIGLFFLLSTTFILRVQAKKKRLEKERVVEAETTEEKK